MYNKKYAIYITYNKYFIKTHNSKFISIINVIIHACIQMQNLLG